MSAIEILILDDSRGGPEEPHGLVLRAGETIFTRLLRPNSNEPDNCLRAPPAHLAFWLVDNWWRLRWESIPPTGMNAEWRLAHELASIGGGYVWPRLAMWDEGERTGLASRSDPPGIVGPVRFLTDALLFVPATDFEAETDRFFAKTIDAYARFNSDGQALKAQVQALAAERSDAGILDWRRMEARLGFDPDDAPDEVIKSLIALIGDYGSAGIEEAAMAAPGAAAADILIEEIAAAKASRVDCNFAEALKVSQILKLDASKSPWMLAERAAATIREALAIDRGPIRNQTLAELVGTRAEHFRTQPAPVKQVLPYGLRLSDRLGRRELVALRFRRSHDRRFEIARALGDAIWMGGGRLGPLADSKTACQKFQRAFAQSLLCPYDDLLAYMGTEQPTEGDLFAAAQHFHVSQSVVRTVLVNKHAITRDQLRHVGFRDAAHEGLEDLVDAA